MKNFNRARFVLAFSIATILIASIVFTRASTAVASAQTSQPTPPQQMSVATAHELLARLVGAWNISGEAVSAAGQVEKRLQGRAVWQWALGGVFLFGDTVLNNGAAAIQEVDTIGFNSGGCFVAAAFLVPRQVSTGAPAATWAEKKTPLCLTHLNSDLKFKWDLKSGPFASQTTFNHPKFSIQIPYVL